MAAKATKKSGAALEKLRADIKSGSPENVYIFYGEETYLRDRYLEELKALLVPEGFEEFNYHRLSGKGLTVQDLTEVLLEALRRCGATLEGEDAPAPGGDLTKADMMDKGLVGPNSAARRQQVLRDLGLPEHLTANGLLEALNLLLTREEFEKL